MARPKKTSIHPKEAALFEEYQELDSPLPYRDDLLYAIVCALMVRIRSKDEVLADKIMVLTRAIAARAAYWEKHRPNPCNHMIEAEEWRDSYADLLREIAVGKRTKKAHCMETIVDQTLLLDRYLEEHPEFRKLRNSTTRMEWIERHAPAVNELLTTIPCFCRYDVEKFIEHQFDDNGFREVLVKPKWLKKFTEKGLTSGKLRDAFLAMLHGVEISKVVQIRKEPGSLTTEAPDAGIYDDRLLSFGLDGLTPSSQSHK